MSEQTQARDQVVYLACPYTHPEASVRLSRFHSATRAAAALIARRHIVFSPITMTHPIDIEMAGESGTLGSEFWVEFDKAFMDRCDLLALLPLEGWDSSRGVTREIEYFASQKKRLFYLDREFRLQPLETLLRSGHIQPPLQAAKQ